MTSDYAARSRPDLSFDEVAQLFPFTIAEAATALGVTTNDLKRICRENGVTRWPYRKILAGKSIEDIRKEAAKEKALMEQQITQMPPHLESNPVHGIKLRAFSLATPTSIEKERMALDPLRRQAMGSVHRFPVHSSLKPLQIDHRAQLQHHHFQLRANIPTYLDDFRHGFPSKKLPVSSIKWWGSLPSSNTEKEDRDLKGDTDGPESSATLPKDGLNQIATSEDSSNAVQEKKGEQELMPASILARTRKNAVASGRKAMRLAVTRGYGTYHLGDKDEALLKSIFVNSFPSLWAAAVTLK